MLHKLLINYRGELMNSKKPRRTRENSQQNNSNNTNQNETNN